MIRRIENPIVDQMLDGETVNVMYTDPPWGDGNLKYWATMNRKQTGAEFTPISYDHLIACIDRLIKRVDGYVFIETGQRWRQKLITHFEDIGLFNVTAFDLEYNHPNTIVNPCIFGGTAPQYKFTHNVQWRRNDARAVTEIIGAVARSGDVVLDPCCGMGFTAQACVNLGLSFRGNEFNAARLEKTIARLERG
jgi:hypothetical protein